MKEVPSKEMIPWVGKLLTCATCNRSFIVQIDDNIQEACHRVGKKHSCMNQLNLTILRSS